MTETTTKTPGRPPKTIQDQRFYDGALHALLVGKLPEHAAGGRIIVRRIAGLTGYANYTVYRWLQNDRLTPRAARALIITFEGRISKDDLVPFVLG